MLKIKLSQKNVLTDEIYCRISKAMPRTLVFFSLPEEIYILQGLTDAAAPSVKLPELADPLVECRGNV
jgi:hypothetical protein